MKPSTKKNKHMKPSTKKNKHIFNVIQWAEKAHEGFSFKKIKHIAHEGFCRKK